MLQLKAGQLLPLLEYAKALCQVCAAMRQFLLWLSEQLVEIAVDDQQCAAVAAESKPDCKDILT